MPYKVTVKRTGNSAKLLEKVHALSARHSVSCEELMPPSFIRQYTDFETVEEMFAAGGVKSKEDLASEQFSQLIANRTKFDTWQDMVNRASAEYVSRKTKI